MVWESASRDDLSGLLSSFAVKNHVSEYLKTAKPDSVCAVYMMDLENFKQVNDTLGHPMGDQVIQSVGRVLSSLFRASDIVGRMEEDKFLAFIGGPLTDEVIRRKAEAICENLQFAIGAGRTVHVTVSVGVYVGLCQGQTFDGLCEQADFALHRAKSSGKNCFYIGMGSSPGKQWEEVPWEAVSTIKLSTLIENINGGISLIEVGSSLRLLYASPGFLQMLDEKKEDFKIPCEIERIGIHPEDLPDYENAVRGIAKNGGIADRTYRISKDQIHWKWLHARAVKISYPGTSLPVVLSLVMDASTLKEKQEALEEQNECLRNALGQTGSILWETDISKRLLKIIDIDAEFNANVTEVENVPDTLVENGWIHPDSVSRFENFSEDLLNGREQDRGSFIIQNRTTHSYDWKTISYRMMYDDSGRPRKAVGIMECFPNARGGGQAMLLRRRPMPEILRYSLIVSLRVNLTRNIVEEFWQEGENRTDAFRHKRYSDIAEKESERVFPKGKREEVMKKLRRDTKLRDFENGELWQFLEYRRIHDNGSICWVLNVTNLVEDPETHEILLFVYISNAEQRHQWESSVNREIRTDPVTGLYDRDTAQVLIQERLKDGSGSNCSLALIQIVGLTNIFTEDREKNDQKWRFISAALALPLYTDCIMGRYDEDKILVFFPDSGTRLNIRRRLEDAFSFARFSLAGAMEIEALRFVAGVSYERIEETDYGSMLSQALREEEIWKNSGTDTVVFHRENEDWGWAGNRKLTEREDMVVERQEMERSLSGEEKGIALNCMASMLESNSLDMSINSVLRYLGQYYHASRVYILSLGEERNMLTMPYEWDCREKHSIQRAVFGMKIDNFLLLRRCMEERAPIFLSGREESTEGRMWRFTVFPLIENETITGFLCIENPQKHPADAALLGTLIPYIMGEKKRFRSAARQMNLANHDTLTDMPNLRAYLDTIYAINSDNYSTMGALALDIPNLPSINSSLGYDYGRNMLMYISEIMTDIFGRDYLFRTWESEFVALCSNTTQEVFLGRCTRLRVILQRRYPKQLRIGYTWADGIFSAADLVKEAQSIMRCEYVSLFAKGKAENLLNPEESLVQKETAAGHFTVFFQPKIDMRTGDCVGAEALVRGIDEKGGIVSPARFIESMEKSGAIRDLDLFVMNQTFAFIEEWMKKGLEPVRVSVNFSRITLFSPTAPAAVLAIQSNHPEVPMDLVEVEITETAGDITKDTLSQVIDKYRVLGMRFSLDDFGSHYANMSVFTNIKFDTIKLDRSLINELSYNMVGRMLVEDIVNICGHCGMTCIAEGVESKAQEDALLEAGCFYAQGYYYDRPLPEQEFERKYLKKKQEREFETCRMIRNMMRNGPERARRSR